MPMFLMRSRFMFVNKYCRKVVSLDHQHNVVPVETNWKFGALLFLVCQWNNSKCAHDSVYLAQVLGKRCAHLAACVDLGYLKTLMSKFDIFFSSSEIVFLTDTISMRPGWSIYHHPCLESCQPRILNLDVFPKTLPWCSYVFQGCAKMKCARQRVIWGSPVSSFSSFKVRRDMSFSTHVGRYRRP